MANEEQRTRVWENWLSAEMRANCFADLSSSNREWQKWATYLTLLFSSGALLSIVAQHAWLPPVLALVTSVLSLYLVISRYEHNAVDASELHARWNRIASTYRDLWENLEGEPNIRERLLELDEVKAELSDAGLRFGRNEKRMAKWYDHVVSHHPTHA